MPFLKLVTSLIPALLISTFPLSQAAEAEIPTVDCDVKTLTDFCESVKAKEKTQLRSRIPYKFSNGESMPSADSISGDSLETTESGALNLPWGKMQRLQKLFVQTKKYAQDAILQGRGYDQLSEEEKNLFERIKTMKLSEFRTAEEREICRSGSRFGFSPQHHTLVMCPEMAGYPSSAIVWSMAAFIGRGLGHCATGVVKYVDSKKKLVWDRIPADKHPFNSHLRSCLIQGGYPDGSQGLDFSKPELKKFVDNEIARSHQSKNPDLPTPSSKLAEALKDDKNIEWAKKNVTDYRECFPEQTNSRVDSGIQDWFGSEVAARYLEDHPLNAQTPEDNLQPVAAMVDFICRTPKADELNRKFHVENETRFTSAIFANERLRKAMNCSPKAPAKRICDIGPRLESPRHGGASGRPSGTSQDTVK